MTVEQKGTPAEALGRRGAVPCGIRFKNPAVRQIDMYFGYSMCC